MIPVAMGQSSLPSLAVKMLLRTWPNSFPMLVTQAAVPAAAPASFLVTYYKVEKNNRYSNYNNCLSNKRNIFELGGWGRGGGGCNVLSGVLDLSYSRYVGVSFTNKRLLWI